MGQCERVLQYIKDFGSINPAQAFLDLGCYRLGARIYDLRHKHGYSIKKTTVSAKHRYGEAVSYAEYRLEDNNAE
mgnify:FL=1